MSRDSGMKLDTQRYRALGLVANPFANPFAQTEQTRFDGVELATAAESNRLVSQIIASAAEAKPKPLVVIKSAEIPAFYPMRAVGAAERVIITDESINVLHAYVQLFMMRLGRVRSIISILSERLAFREFDKTLEIHIAKMLDEPRVDLTAYQVLGDDGLRSFAERFAADPEGTVKALFGDERVERRPELANLADNRIADLQSDVDEDDAQAELDATTGDAPANAILLAEQGEGATEDENNDQLVVDYIIEYTKSAFSPVIARALRIYRERGLGPLVSELNITKAPKKTLSALVRFAVQRFDKVLLIFDGFDAWFGVPPETKSLIAGELSELRWKLEGDAMMIFMLEEDGVVELEEQFGGGNKMRWEFPAIPVFEKDPESLDVVVIEGLLAGAAAPGEEPIAAENPILAELRTTSAGFTEFATRAYVAIEDAADRGVAALDASALEHALGAPLLEVQSE